MCTLCQQQLKCAEGSGMIRHLDKWHDIRGLEAQTKTKRARPHHIARKYFQTNDLDIVASACVAQQSTRMERSRLASL